MRYNALRVGGLLAGVTLCGWLLDPYVTLTSQAMLYVLAVVVASYSLEWVASVACAVGAVLALNFFFVPPRWTLEVENRQQLIALAALLAVALVTSHLATGLRRQTALAQRSARRAHQLQTLATRLAGVTTATEIFSLGQSALDDAFVGPCTLVAVQQDGTLDGQNGIAPGVQDGLRCCMREAAVLGPGTGRWPGLEAWYLPLGGAAHMVGAACVRPADARDDDGREHAQALCALLTQALQRVRLAESVQRAQAESQRQQLQSTFLAAVSHDLRTPLAVVVGAASSLQTQRDKLSVAEQERLLDSIVSEANYLSTITENTLQLVRLSSAQPQGAAVLQRDWESVEEIVGAVLARVRQRDPGRRIQSRVAPDLPLVQADPVLLAQLIGNLLDNALRYSADGIELGANVNTNISRNSNSKEPELLVCVKDRGPGISPSQQAQLFQPFARGDQSGARGAGLGLAVCRAIAQAHGGSLDYRRRGNGGSAFTLRLPVVPQPLQQELP